MRQTHREFRALSYARRQCDGAAQSVDHLPHERQSEAGGRRLFALITWLERLEDVCLMLTRDARTGVGDREPTRPFVEADGDAHLSLLRGAQAVFDQMQQDQAHELAISL